VDAGQQAAVDAAGLIRVPGGQGLAGAVAPGNAVKSGGHEDVLWQRGVSEAHVTLDARYVHHRGRRALK
jgi:hypothetical protein